MTKIEMLNSIRTAVSDNADMVAFIDHEIELLQRKASTPRKPTKTQIENVGLRDGIVAFLEAVGTPQTVKDITANVEGLDSLSNQRVTHLLTALRKDGIVIRTVVKKVPYYALGFEEGYADTNTAE